MDYRYYKDNVLMIGKMQSGKTYNARLLLSKVPKDNVIMLDSHDEYGDLEPVFMRTVPERPYNVSWIDDMIETVYTQNLYHKVVVFDDMDLFIKFNRESEKLADFFIDSSHIGKGKVEKDGQGSGIIILMKRPVNLDMRVLQASRYIMLFKGCLSNDVKYIFEKCSLPEKFIGSDDINTILNTNQDNTYLHVEADTEDKYPFLIIDNIKKTAKYCATLSI